MRIEQIRLKNFRVFQDVTVSDIPALAVFVGANGSGKSTLFDVFGFLKDCLTTNVSKALQQRGGYKEVVSREKEGENIEIEIKFRLDIAGVARLVTYLLEINQYMGRAQIVREILRYKRSSYGSPFHFLHFESGKGKAVTNEEDFTKKDEELNREDHSLDAPDILAIKGIGQFRKFKAASAFRELIENWHVSDFHISRARGSKDIIGEDKHLSPSGENLQLVANNLYEYHPEVFKNILEKMQRTVPGIEAVQPEEMSDGRLLLRFKDGSFKDPFADRFVSDGTIKMFAYLVLLHDPEPHPLLCIEEPENQLYPKLLGELLEELRRYATSSGQNGQVFVSTHSPDLLNSADLEEVFWLVKDSGYASVSRAADDQQIVSLCNEGDKLGYLWKQGFFTGADPV